MDAVVRVKDIRLNIVKYALALFNNKAQIKNDHKEERQSI